MRHINSREEMIATLLQIAFDSNLVGAIKDDVNEWSTDLNWMNDLTKTQRSTLETDFVSKCISLANSLMTEKELNISENDPLALLDYKEYDLAEIQDSTNVELNNLKAENEILTNNYNELKETTDLAIDNLTLEVESLKNNLHDANETIYEFSSEPKREKLANEIINLKEKNNELEKRQMTPLLKENKTLTDALKNSLSQIAYLVETVKTFDADFFKIKDFNSEASFSERVNTYFMTNKEL